MAKLKSVVCLFVIYLIVSYQPVFASTLEDLNRLISSHTNLKSRITLVESLSKEPFEEVVPALLPLLAEYKLKRLPPTRGDEWRYNHAPQDNIIFTALSTIWQLQLKEKHTRKTTILLSLLKSSQNQNEISLLIEALDKEQWDGCAEKPLVDFSANKQQNNFIRLQALFAVMRNISLQKYFDQTFSIIKSLSLSEQVFAVNDLSRIIYFDKQKLTPKQQSKVINYAFPLLETLKEKNMPEKYSLAKSLGLIVNNTFSPDIKLSKYKIKTTFKNGSWAKSIAPNYWDDTVDNALKWYAIHKNEYKE